MTSRHHSLCEEDIPLVSEFSRSTLSMFMNIWRLSDRSEFLLCVQSPSSNKLLMPLDATSWLYPLMLERSISRKATCFTLSSSSSLLLSFLRAFFVSFVGVDGAVYYEHSFYSSFASHLTLRLFSFLRSDLGNYQVIS